MNDEGRKEGRKIPNANPKPTSKNLRTHIRTSKNRFLEVSGVLTFWTFSYFGRFRVFAFSIFECFCRRRRRRRFRHRFRRRRCSSSLLYPGYAAGRRQTRNCGIGPTSSWHTDSDVDGKKNRGKWERPAGGRGVQCAFGGVHER